MKMIDKLFRILFLWLMFFLIVKNLQNAALLAVFYNILYEIKNKT